MADGITNELEEITVDTADLSAVSQQTAAINLDIRGPRLDQLMLAGVVLLVLLVVAGSGVIQVQAISKDYKESAERQTARVQNQAKETGRSYSRLISLTAASPLRDNNYGALGELVASTTANDPNVLRAQIVDADGNVVADTDKEQPKDAAKRAMEEKVTSGFYKGRPIYEYQLPIDVKGTITGLVVLTYSLDALQAELQLLDVARRESIENTARRTAFLALAFVVASAVLAWALSRRVTRPLAELTLQAMALAAGNMAARVRRRFVGAGREVRTLGAVFNHMAEQLNQSVELAAKKAGLEQEMNVARRVQETLLPARSPFEFGALRVAGAVFPADQCGGDWWLRAPIDDHRIAVSLGDVAGHGLSTALIGTSALSAFAAVLRTHHPDHVDAELFMLAVNQTLFHVGHGEYQMSCAMMVFDTVDGSLQYVNGGHPFPCVYNRQTGQTSSAPVRGPLLGKTATMEAKTAVLQIKPGDVFVWYTDGVLEARDAAGQTFGWKGLTASVQRNGNLPAERLRDALIADVHAFTGGGKQEDDLTVVVAEYSPR